MPSVKESCCRIVRKASKLPVLDKIRIYVMNEAYRTNIWKNDMLMTAWLEEQLSGPLTINISISHIALDGISKRF